MLKGIPLHLHCALSPWEYVEGDEQKLKQVILNLLSNAVKLTERGSVDVSAVIREASGGELSLLIGVRDTGIGIPAELCADLFERFTQADSSTTRKYGGTGLGLAISKQIIELMGAQISVRSTPKAGSTFSFSVQVRACKRAEAEPIMAVQALSR